MKKQSHKDKMDEHLGAKHGKEAKHKQSMKDRRHEMEGMKKKAHAMKHSMKHTKEDLAAAHKHMKMHGG